ncbi:hypothetical protein LguiA_012577 [Lonicera macranthoides]
MPVKIGRIIGKYSIVLTLTTHAMDALTLFMWVYEEREKLVVRILRKSLRSQDACQFHKTRSSAFNLANSCFLAYSFKTHFDIVASSLIQLQWNKMAIGILCVLTNAERMA